jgi:GalNAc-alpha-(1->4)-GalNAc-alpha-(1->3)-diNAcBac-PP-undecaprenol alpha-1,4-N-acetyl-D-galactosaminyltransferase
MEIENQKNENQLRITFVLGSLTAGGAEKVASFLMNSLHKQGHKISLISRIGAEEDFFPVPESVKRIVLGGEGESANKWLGLLKNVFYVSRLRKALKSTRPDVVISFLTRPNIYTILASRFLECSVIVSERNDTKRQKHGWPWHKLRKRLYKYADVVTANSQAALDGMVDYVTDDKLVFIPNPVIIPGKIAKPDQSKVILNVGRLEKVKNQQVIMDAFGLSDIYKQGWRLEFLGDGSERKNLLQYKNELHLGDNIHFAGLVKNIQDYYSKAGIFILASDFEGTPNALLEAMAQGLPSIVSDSLPGAVDLIGDDCGLVFRHGSSEDLSAKMSALINSAELRKEMGINARKKVGKFSPDSVFCIWNDIINGP